MASYRDVRGNTIADQQLQTNRCSLWRLSSSGYASRRADTDPRLIPILVGSFNHVASDKASELTRTALAYHYAQLQSLAFEEDFDPAEAEDLDKTLPKHYGMHKAAGEYMKEWNIEIKEDERGFVEPKGASKRGAVEVSPQDATIKGMVG